MSNELTPLQGTAVQRQTPANTGSLVSALAAAASDPTVDVNKMLALAKLFTDIKAFEARQAYNLAMNAIAISIVPVIKNQKNSHTNSLYADLTAIDEAIRPIYAANGISLSFNSITPVDPTCLRIRCDICHVEGHVEVRELEGPLDVAGSAGKVNKTVLQGIGSTDTYLRRYLTLMIFNVPVKNSDKDGNKIADMTPISDSDVMALRDVIEECANHDQKFKVNFSDWIKSEFNADNLSSLRQSQLLIVQGKLNEKRTKLGIK